MTSQPTPDAQAPKAANENTEINAPVETQAPHDEAAAKIETLTQELAQMRDQWVRAAAETENVRKRAERDRDETAKYAITAFARDMVSILETLKRASESISPEARKSSELLNTIGQGVDMTLQELLGTFERYHIKRIDPLNQKFDHNFHQAVVQVERADVPPGTVIQVVQAGYVIHDRLLRPAMVAVSKQGEPVKQVDTSA